jgi:hypothetical protein
MQVPTSEEGAAIGLSESVKMSMLVLMVVVIFMAGNQNYLTLNNAFTFSEIEGREWNGNKFILVIDSLKSKTFVCPFYFCITRSLQQKF